MSNLITQIQAHWNPPLDYQLAKNEFRVSTSVYCSLRVFFDKLSEMPELQNSDQFSLIDDIPETRDLRLEGVFAAGHAYHHYVQKILPDTYVKAIEKEVTYEHKPDFMKASIKVIGHVDLILEENAKLKVCDIKTCKASSYSYKTHEANWHHRQQANLYAFICNIPKYSILYINKETFAMTEHESPTDSKLALKLLDKLALIYVEVIETVYKLQQGEKLTGKEIKASCEDWECRYCPYNEVCPQ